MKTSFKVNSSGKTYEIVKQVDSEGNAVFFYVDVEKRAEEIARMKEFEAHLDLVSNK